MNATANVTVILSCTKIDSFPSAEITRLVSSSEPFSEGREQFSFLLKPLEVGEHPVEVQIWWNGSEVDSELLVIRVYDVIDPSVFAFYLRFWFAFLLPVFTFIEVQIANPQVRFQTTDKSGKVSEIDKKLILIGIAIIYWLAFFMSIPQIDTYYSLVSFVLPSIGRIEGVLVIGVLTSAFCWLSILTGRFDWGIRMSYIILLLLFFSIIWDWILFPLPSLGLFEPLAKFAAAVVVGEILRLIWRRIRPEK
jgi:hypothetical protein